jgi:ligand-binding sensor domain-containing protein
MYAAPFFRPIVAASLTFLFAASTQAQTNSWMQAPGPAGGNINVFATIDDGDVFAGTYGGGVFRSSDNGGTWVAVNNGLMNGYVNDLLISSNTGGLYAATDDGVFLSPDNGEAWMNTGLTTRYISSLVLDVNDVLAGSFEDGVFRWSNSTGTWTQINEGLPDDGLGRIVVRDLLVSGRGEIFAATVRGIHSSKDGGKSWQNKSSGIGSTSLVQRLAIDADGFLYAASRDKVFQSADDGFFWLETSSPEGGFGGFVHALAVNADDHLFAGTDTNGVFVSVDRGVTWKNVSKGLEPSRVQAIDFRSRTGIGGATREDVFAGTDDKGIFRSDVADDLEWNGFNDGLTHTTIAALAIGPNGDLFAGTGNNRTLDATVFRSSDRGASWTPLNVANFSYGSIGAIAVDSGGTVFVGSADGPPETDGLFASTDNGSSWTAIPTTAGPVRAIAINNVGHIYVGQGGEVVRSVNGGASFSPRGDLSDQTVVSLATFTEELIFVGTYDGLYRSDNEGEDYLQIGDRFLDPDEDAVLALAVTPVGDVLAGGEAGLFLSTDFGEEWTEVDTSEVFSLLAGNGGFVFAGTENGVLVSKDGGSTWAPFNDGLGFHSVEAFVLFEDGDLLAGTRDGGMFTSAGANPFVVDDAYNTPRLTLLFEKMNPHVGQKFEVRVKDTENGNEVGRHSMTEVPGPDFEISLNSLLKGRSYQIEFYADLNGNGEYDDPPADHAWRMGLSPARGNDTLSFEHHMNFASLEWTPFLDAGRYEAIWRGVASVSSAGTEVDVRAHVRLDLERGRVEGRLDVDQLINLDFEGPLTIDGDSIWVEPRIRTGKRGGLTGSFLFTNLNHVDADFVLDTLGTTTDLKFEGTLGRTQAIFEYQSDFFDAEGFIFLEEDSVLILSPVAIENGVELPAESEIRLGNFPDPFESVTVIEYELPDARTVVLTLFDYLGRRVAVLEDGRMSAGAHSVKFDATNLPSGVYFYRIEAGRFVATRSMFLTK